MNRSSLLRKAAVAFVATLLVGLSACGSGGSDAPPTRQPPVLPPPSGGNVPYSDPVAYSTASGASLAAGVDAAAITKHQITLRGTTYAYTATTGHLTARHPVTHDDEASFFYVAYTLDNQNTATRPVTFFYNGGPGSASVWLHLGSFGPKRLVTGDPATNAPTPFALVDNAETLLDTTDLVFVDAVGTGYSQAIQPATNQTYWGVDADAFVFRDFVMRYVAVNQRDLSPKFLFGESYGTTRSAVLARQLETAGVTLHGVVLQSSVLNYNSNCALFAGSQVSCGGYLPSYAATGAWFNRTVPAQPDLPLFMQQMRGFTAATYEPADAAWIASHALPSATVLQQLQDSTGITTNVWGGQFNLQPASFQRNLIGGQLLGRYDARVTAPVGSFLASEGDPSSTFIGSQFAAAMERYLVDFLQYGSASTYVVLSNAINGWTFSHDGNAFPDVVPDLLTALTLNPSLKVLAVNGYHDLATPFYRTELDLARISPNPNISIRSYVGGHMTYLDEVSRPLERADLETFYQAALVMP